MWAIYDTIKLIYTESEKITAIPLSCDLIKKNLHEGKFFFIEFCIYYIFIIYLLVAKHTYKYGKGETNKKRSPFFRFVLLSEKSFHAYR